MNTFDWFTRRQQRRAFLGQGGIGLGSAALTQLLGRDLARGAATSESPAVGLPGGWMAEIADAMFASPDYTDAAEARSEKTSGSWADVDDAQLDTEFAEHLVTLPGGRVGWRISIPAMMAYWSELARDITLPPKDIPVTVVRAAKTSPPYVTPRLVEALQDRPDFRLIEMDCHHMVPLARPAETAQLIRERLS